MILGTAFGLVAGVFDVDQWSRLGDWLLPLCAVAGLIAGLTRIRPALWIANGAGMAALIIISYTPVAAHLMHAWEMTGDASASPAVVVLSGYVLENGEMSTSSQDRMLHGFELMKHGDAPVMVLTRSAKASQTWEKQVSAQMDELGLHFPMMEVGPVSSTHDEAVRVAELARTKGWSQVILVTHSWHMRRAAAVFEKAGIHVIPSPCRNHEFDTEKMATADDRIHAFNIWMHEAVGYEVYRLHGWI